MDGRNTATVDGEDSYCFTDSHGFLHDPDKVKEILKKAEKFYAAEDIKEFVKEENKKNMLETTLDSSVDLDNGEKIKLELPTAEKRCFDPAKRNWSYHCELCNTKVSSKTDECYYIINQTPLGLMYVLGFNYKVCSPECGYVVAKEEFNNWIHENGYENYVIIEGE